MRHRPTTFNIFGNARVALRDQRQGRHLLGHAANGTQKVRGPDPAVGPKGDGPVRKLRHQIDHSVGGDAHHRAPCGVKTHRATPGHAGRPDPGGGGHEEVDDELGGHLVLVLRRVDQLARAVAEVAGHLEIINQA